MQKSEKAHNACYEVGDKVRLWGAEVWTVERVYLSLYDASLWYCIRRGCCHKIVSAGSISRYEV